MRGREIKASPRGNPFVRAGLLQARKRCSIDRRSTGNLTPSALRLRTTFNLSLTLTDRFFSINSYISIHEISRATVNVHFRNANYDRDGPIGKNKQTFIHEMENRGYRMSILSKSIRAMKTFWILVQQNRRKCDTVLLVALTRKLARKRVILVVYGSPAQTPRRNNRAKRPVYTKSGGVVEGTGYSYSYKYISI